MSDVHDNIDITAVTNSFINNLYKKGFWQVLMCIIIEQIIMYMGAFIAFSGTFTSAHMDYMCNIPSNHSSLKASINHCDVWNDNSNTTERCPFGYRFNPDKAFVETSMKADLQLICERSYLDGVSQSCVMAGFFIGGIIGPIIADKIGRRFVLFVSLFIGGAFGILMGFANNIYLIIIGSLILGIMREVAMSTGFVYGLEFVPNYKQSWFGLVTQLFWAANITLLGVMAYFIRDWRYLQVVGSLPIFLSGFFVFIVPESPRWLIVNGKFEQVHNLVERFANRINRDKTPSSECILLQKVFQEYCAVKTKGEKSTAQYSPLDIFRSRILFFWTVILIFNWMFIILSYYSSTMLLVNLPGNKYLSFILTSSLELPSLLITFFIIQRGRNVTFMLYCSLCALCYILVGFIAKEWTTIILLLSILGKNTLSGLFYMIVVTSVYIYPTSIRTFGTGLPSAIGKLFAVIVPYFVKLHLVHNWLPTLIIGVSACFIGALNLFFPDWVNKPLPETIEDLDLLKKTTGIKCERRNFVFQKD